MATPPLYPNAPIAMVILEVRHPASELSNPAVAFLKEALQEHTPIERTELGVELSVQTGEHRPVSIKKLVSRDRHTAITLRPEAIVLECTDYRGWEWFRSLARDALAARQEVSPVDGVERIGLRYIDEVRVPDGEPIEWSKWVAHSLLGPSELSSRLCLSVEQQQSAIQYSTGVPGQTLTLRYGVGRGSVVQSTENLRRLKEPPATSPYFLIDTDGAWADSSGGIPAFNVDEIVDRCDSLHSPSKQMFESLVTSKLKNEVLNRVE